MALLTPFFYLLGFKTISPDITNITKKIGDGRIILTSDKLIPKLDLLWACRNEYDISSGNLDDYEDGSPDEKLEIEYNNEYECSIYSIYIYKNYMNTSVEVVYYSINYSKNSSLDFKRMALSNSNIE